MTATPWSGRSNVPISGSAATLDKATAAMLKSYGQMRAKARLRKPQAELTTLICPPNGSPSADGRPSNSLDQIPN